MSTRRAKVRQTIRRYKRKTLLPPRQKESYQLIDGNYSPFPVAFCKHYRGYLSVGLIATHKCEQRCCRSLHHLSFDNKNNIINDFFE